MRTEEFKKKTLNLCDTCMYHPAECSGEPKFGTGKGNDNIYKCTGYKK